MEKTGHAKGTTAGADLSHHCVTVKMDDATDNLVYIHVTSGQDGVSQIELQTSTKPSTVLGNPDETSIRYAYENKNWENFSGTRGFYGLYGYNDPTTGDMRALGFIEKDLTCTANFQNKIAPENYTWITPIPGNEQTRATLPLEYQTYL